MSISERLAMVSAAVAETTRQAGRRAEDVSLLAVSKMFPAEAIEEAFAAGQLQFGENRVQEALTKKESLPEAIRWHLIGPLQRNKVRKVVGAMDCLQGIDSLKLANVVNRVAEELGVVQKVLLQVNIGGERSKSGFEKEELCEVLSELLAFENLDFQGTMTIPPPAESEGSARKSFEEMRLFTELLRETSCLALPELSMGMSGDFKAAILEGSTMVRVGSAIFGSRG